MESENLKLEPCPDCGGLKVEGAPCRQCERMASGSGGFVQHEHKEPRAARGYTTKTARRARFPWVIVVLALIVICGSVAAIVVPRVAAGYEKRFDDIARAMKARAINLSELLLIERWDGQDLAKAKQLRDALMADCDKALKLKPAAERITAHSLLTGAAANYYDACVKTTGCIEAVAAGADLQALRQEALTALGNGHSMIDQGLRMLSEPPEGST